MSASPLDPWWRHVRWLGALSALLLLGGCQLLGADSGGALTLRGAHQPERTLPAEFDLGLYSFDNSDSVTIVLVQGTVASDHASDDPSRRIGEIEQAMTIRLFWEPRPGQTPLARDATNAMVRYVRFESTDTGESERHVSVYSGAGFLWPRTNPGEATFRARLREATLRLIDASDDAPNPIEQATLVGRFTARRDDPGTQRLVRRLETAVSEALRYPRFVQRASPSK